MTSLLYHVGGEDSLQGRQHMFKLKYRIISQTGKGNCEQHKEYVLSPFYDVSRVPQCENPYSNINRLKTSLTY